VPRERRAAFTEDDAQVQRVLMAARHATVGVIRVTKGSSVGPPQMF